MRCDDVRIKLSGYLDGEVSSEEKKAVEGHLSGCEACRRALSELEKTVGCLRAVGEVEPPPWFTQKVMQRVREESAKKTGLLRRLFFPLRVKLPAEALALALVAVAAVYVFNMIKPEVQMKVAAGPAAEAPAPAVPEERIGELRDEMKEAAPSEDRRARVLGNEGEEEKADVLRKTEESAYKSKKPEAVPEKDFAPQPPILGRGDSAGDADAEMEKGFDFDKTYAASEAMRGAVEVAAALEISVAVPDVKTANSAVVDAITKVGGRVIEGEPVEEDIVMAEVPSGRVDELIEELEEIGDVEAGAHEAPEGESFLIRLELKESP